jgi:sugar/nucleoside kinase (ribokinase family)
MVVKHPFKISGTGVALVDYLYSPVNFNSTSFQKYRSKTPGDGGIEPGKLVLRGEFESFTGKDYLDVRNNICSHNAPAAINVGGPSIVSLIHAAQMLYNHPVQVNFYGARGKDEGGLFLEEKLSQIPLNIEKIKIVDQHTPFTDVLSDPTFDKGHGERAFINNIGASWDVLPEDLDDEFFNSEIVVFGGTALVPKIHSKLEFLLSKAKRQNAFTIVNTVYDFLSENEDPSKPWPMGNTINTFHYIDLLITDMEEALRLSNTETPEDAMKFFKYAGTGAVIITHGGHPLHYFSCHALLGDHPPNTLPVSESVSQKIRMQDTLEGDTTGCGDNFVGGVIVSLAIQMIAAPGKAINLPDAIALGVASGGFACFYHGGTFYEEEPGQKALEVGTYYRDYLQQTGIE